ncbi:phosphatase PAP2 family protein [Rubrivivax rivuli]|uniref:Phosphatase PAP2 family protein n=1 Tax=Rubrivivax rivuli TaxID=1862385 RepID=A0A437RAX7_9BURK|nr:phosphatase PAP2 family protein [Rubrivivax rivuli]
MWAAGPRAAARSPRARLLIGLLLALVLLLAWDASGADLAVAGWFADATGFRWRDAWWTRGLLHEGGRVAGLLALAALAAHAFWPTAATSAAAQPTRAERLYALVVVLLVAGAVPALKRLSLSSCPWDLALFGGVAQHVSHWRLGVPDGGPGRCFPSGHAVTAFALWGAVLPWRHHRPRRAWAIAVGVAAAGLLLGAGQVLRGAHYPSHVLWSAWLCAALVVAAALVQLWLFERLRLRGRPLP